MGVLNRGILGGFRGSVGPVTGTSWKGIDVMKSKPLSVANPRTAGQVAQRSKFTAIVQIASTLLVLLVKPFWDRFAQRQSGYNAMVSANIDNFDASGDIIDPADMIMSRGSWDGLDSLSAFAASDDGVVGGNNATTGGISTDIVQTVLYNETTGDWEAAPATTTRADGAHGGVFTIPLTIGDTVHMYTSVKRADGTAVSNSQYETGTVVSA